MAKSKPNPVEFLQQVRQEGSKVTWTQKNELIVTTIMVFIMVAFASVFFLLVDWALSSIVDLLLGL